MLHRSMIAGLAAVLVCAPAAAERRPQSFEELFAPLSQGACVEMDDLRKVSAIVQLTPDQFQFVRAFCMATPPETRELPPGDKAFLAKDAEGVVVMGLYDDGGQVCAVFKATDWLERLVDEVGRGESGKRGQPT
jgi:hypothetical protein